MNKKSFWLIAIMFFLIIILGLLILLIPSKKTPNLSQNSLTNQVCFKRNCFSVELATNPVSQAVGLMFRKKLDQGRGMLFIFDKEDIYSFWMKNTLIPLDIIWLNEKKEIVFISADTQPCQQTCPSITPNQKAKYVLEINAGLTEKLKMKIGDQLILELK